jgi:hypothetical protein
MYMLINPTVEATPYNKWIAQNYDNAVAESRSTPPELLCITDRDLITDLMACQAVRTASSAEPVAQRSLRNSSN